MLRKMPPGHLHGTAEFLASILLGPTRPSCVMGGRATCARRNDHARNPITEDLPGQAGAKCRPFQFFEPVLTSLHAKLAPEVPFPGLRGTNKISFLTKGSKRAPETPEYPI